MKFIATKLIRSAAPMSPPVCNVGDEVVIKGWYCKDGPTAITVNGKDDCVPFSWVVSAGMPPEMAAKIPTMS